jgi:hypothetical protein
MLFSNVPRSPFLIGLLTIVLVSTFIEVKSELICPTNEVTKPCYCYEDIYSLYCTGEAITQSAIENLFTSVRLTNGLAPDEWLNVDVLMITRTNLTALDLTPFARSNFTNLDINYNPTLEIVVGGTNSTLSTDIDPLQFRAEAINLDRNNLNDIAVGEVLKFTDPISLKVLSLERNRIEGSARAGGNGGEFLPNLSTFRQLERLSLYGNIIEKIEGGQFKHNNRLSQILLQENRLSVVGENAFHFDEWSPDVLNTRFHISLSVNRLADESIHPLSGLESFGRQLFIYAQLNNFKSLSVERFGAILLADCRNYIYVGGNYFNCDDRMRWLKEHPEFEKRVEGVDCRNDPGKTIFTTEIVTGRCESMPCQV